MYPFVELSQSADAPCLEREYGGSARQPSERRGQAVIQGAQPDGGEKFRRREGAARISLLPLPGTREGPGTGSSDGECAEHQEDGAYPVLPEHGGMRK